MKKLAIALGLAIGLVGLRGGDAMAGGFSRSCVDIRYIAADLWAACKDEHGSWQENVMRLGDYITNYNGYLKWAPRGNFQDSCHDCFLRLEKQGPYLFCSCSYNGRSFLSGLDLNEYISNRNGALKSDFYNP